MGRIGALPFEGPSDGPGARDLAIVALSAARRGEDGRKAVGRRRASAGLTLNDIFDAYAAAGFPRLDGTGRKRESTICGDRSRFELLIRDSLGRELVSQIGTEIVQRWADGIAREGQKRHAIVSVKTLLKFAETRGLAEVRPIRVKPGRSRKVQNFYSPAELVCLDATLVALIAERPERIQPFSALRLLLHTGARLSEVLSAKWTDVDAEHSVLKLARDKASLDGRDVLSPVALRIIAALPRTGSPYIFWSDWRSGHVTSLARPWLEALNRAGLRKVRRHDLRHSFASASIAAGTSLYVTGKLLGHRDSGSTSRYAHLERSVAKDALAKVAGLLSPAAPLAAE